MFHIRHYDKVIHPDAFRGRGLLGFVIRVLNFVRWRLEVLIQLLVVKVTLNESPVDKQQKRKILRAFQLDVAQERLQKEQTSPLQESVAVEVEALRADRYESGAQSSALDKVVSEAKDLPMRPSRLDNLIAAYGPPMRASTKTYAKGHKFTVTGEFEPVVGENSERRD